MSYLVLARKWRPMTFQDVLGQEHVTRTLENAIRNNRIANAYIFSGPRGIGKTSIARILSKAINCENGPTTTPCNTCDSCVEISESRSLDVFEIDGASNNGVDEVRNLRENLHYANTKGKYRIYIIDEVHMLSTGAFNALLKTLEEPPANVLFIFATTEAHKIPPTITSRCQRFTFKRLPIHQISEQIELICKAEGIKIDADSLQLISRKADGSMRDGESLLDQACSFCGDIIQYADLKELFGVIDSELLFHLSDYIRSHDVHGVLDLADLVFVEGYDVGEFLVNAAEHFRNLLVARATESKDLLLVSDADADRYLGEARLFSEKDLLRYINLITETEISLKRTTNPRLKFEFALLKMVKMESGVELAQLLEQLDAIQHLPATVGVPSEPAPKTKTAQSKPVQPGKTTQSPVGSRIAERRQQILSSVAKKETSAANTDSNQKKTTAANKELTYQNIQSIWPAVIEEIRKKRLTLGIFLSEGTLHSLKNGILEMAFSSENNFHSNTVMKSHAFVEETVKAISGGRIKLRCIKLVAGEEKQPSQPAASPTVKGEINASAPSVAVSDDNKISGTSSNTNMETPAETQDILQKFITAVDGEIVG